MDDGSSRRRCSGFASAGGQRPAVRRTALLALLVGADMAHPVIQNGVAAVDAQWPAMQRDSAFLAARRALVSSGPMIGRSGGSDKSSFDVGWT
jgi:hypothetical protein